MCSSILIVHVFVIFMLIEFLEMLRVFELRVEGEEQVQRMYSVPEMFTFKFYIQLQLNLNFC